MDLFVKYILPFLYIVLISFLLQRNKYLRKNGFSAAFIVFFFLLKCVAGIINDYTSFAYNGDVVLYYGDGLVLYETLLHRPGDFIAMLKQMFNITDFGLFNSHSSFIRTVFEAIKLIQFTGDLFSFGNVYTNTILFNGLTVAVLLKCWVFLKKYSNSWAPGALLFLLPSAFFYTSNILKEGLCFSLMASLLPLIGKTFLKPNLKHLLLIFFLCFLLFFFKFIIATTFGIAIIGWWFLDRFPSKRYPILFWGSSSLLLLFFTLRYIHPALDFPAIVVDRQLQFKVLKATSVFYIPTPEASFTGFVKFLPYAAKDVLFKPFPGEGGKLIFAVNTAEVFCFWGFFLFLLIRSRAHLRLKNIRPLYWSHFLYALANLIIVGYIVPNIGALVRYRSIFLPWLAIWLWYALDGESWLKSISSRSRLLSLSNL